ncbi:MAG: exo-alpha-sialidase [Acidobacteria bacterium]|nr:exo-alpha-sialidase [Acidobacteriota bacterium]
MRLLAFLCAAAAFAQEAFQLGGLESQRVVVHQGGYFPRLAMLPSGELLAFFKTGAAHIGKGGRASMSRSADGGKTWSEPVTVFDRPDADDGIVASGVARDGSVMVAAVSYTWKGERYTTDGWTARTWFQRSRDGGRTWGTPVEVNVKPLDWAYPFGHILEESDGTLLLAGYGGPLPVMAAEQRPQASFVVRSHDGGKTWGELTRIAPGHNEITMARRRDGSIVAMMRTVGGARLNSSVSRDAGRTWSAPKQVTEDREHPADLLRLSNGDWLLTFGQRNKPFGVQAMRSRDEGETWERQSRVVLAFDGDHSDVGYPVTIERRDGRLVTVYYIVYGERDSEGLKGIAPKNAFTKAVLWSPPASWKQ